MAEILKEMILYLQDVLWFISTDKYQTYSQKWSVAVSWYCSQLQYRNLWEALMLVCHKAGKWTNSLCTFMLY